jgi:hypothetical protein
MSLHVAIGGRCPAAVAIRRTVAGLPPFVLHTDEPIMLSKLAALHSLFRSKQQRLVGFQMLSAHSHSVQPVASFLRAFVSAAAPAAAQVAVPKEVATVPRWNPADAKRPAAVANSMLLAIQESHAGCQVSGRWSAQRQRSSSQQEPWDQMPVDQGRVALLLELLCQLAKQLPLTIP